MSNVKVKSTNKQECLDDLRRLYALPPYNGSTNYVAHDGYFAQSIRDGYDEKLLAECRKELRVGD